MLDITFFPTNLASAPTYIPPHFGPRYIWWTQFIPGISLQASEKFHWPTVEFKENYLYLVYSHCQDKLELTAALSCSLRAETLVGEGKQMLKSDLDDLILGNYRYSLGCLK